MIKRERQRKLIALVETESQHLTIGKTNVVQDRPGEIGHAEAAVVECAINKFQFFEIRIREVAVRECTLFVFGVLKHCCVYFIECLLKEFLHRMLFKSNTG